ncbi:Ribonuclease H domain [Dillenia turbinata]|uniref:Ribonuclease H domain n=1 Tax=Dillenia turbinata TaxID=194707 RepID=A0AAN8WDI4_9MAGN
MLSGLIWKGDNRWVEMTVGVIGKCGSMHSLTLREGLKLAKAMQISDLQVEVDCLHLVHLLGNQVDENHPLLFIIKDCKHLLVDMKVSRVNNIFRESNCCANRLATVGRNAPRGVTILEYPTPELRKILEDDIARRGKHQMSRVKHRPNVMLGRRVGFHKKWIPTRVTLSAKEITRNTEMMEIIRKLYSELFLEIES